MAEPIAEPRIPSKGPGAVHDPARDTASGRGRASSPICAGGPPQGSVFDAGPPSARAGLERDLSRVDSRKWLRRLGIALGLLALIGAAVLWRVKTRPPPPSRYVTAKVSHGDIAESVQSTGQVKPLTEVQIGAQVSGRITKVFVDFNSRVKKGDVLAEIDPTLFGAQIDSNQAQVAAAKARVTGAEASLTTAKQQVERAKKLVSEGIGSQADLDKAQGSYDVAVADLVAARAQVVQLGAMLKSSKTNLEYTRIFSPIDGIVISRAIDPGQTVAASFQAPTLFVIAQDLRKMRVLADIDESDVGRLAEGMGAEVTVDAFPGETFKGTVSQLRFSPFSQAGVVTYAAVIEVDNPDVKLRPGMTATVTIRSAEAKAALRLPNAALRYKPTPPKDKEGKPIPQEPLPSLPAKRSRIWVVTDATPGAEKAEPRVVDIGISDGIYTELKSDVGDFDIVTDETDDANAKKPRSGRLF